MNQYELAVVISAKVEDEVRTATIDKVKDYVVRFGGTVTGVDEWGKKRLAYEIQKMREGFYYFVQFESDAECPGKLEEVMSIQDNVIRYLCVKKDN